MNKTLAIKPIYYIILIEFVVLVYLIKLIFGNYEVFFKSLADYFFPDEILPNPLDKFAEENDSKHKINILYAVVLLLVGLTILFDIFIL